MADLTAIVLTRNEEKNLPDCLSSLRGFAARVVVVDSGSTDRTVEIAQALEEIAEHLEVISNELNGDPNG